MVVCSQREVEKKVGILRQFAAGFTDYRNTDLIEHRVEELVAQRVHSLALGYEDLNDYGELRNDPLLAVLVEKGKAEIAKEMWEARAQYQETGRAARLFKEFVYLTRESWSRARWVVAKAEHLRNEKTRASWSPL